MDSQNGFIISIHTLRVEGDHDAFHLSAADKAISIHTLRVEGDLQEDPAAYRLPISIHTLRVEGDSDDSFKGASKTLISIHTLRVEGDYTLSDSPTRVSHFYPHPPCGG